MLDDDFDTEPDTGCDACGATHWCACTCVPAPATDQEREIQRMLRAGRLTEAEESELVRLLEEDAHGG